MLLTSVLEEQDWNYQPISWRLSDSCHMILTFYPYMPWVDPNQHPECERLLQYAICNLNPWTENLSFGSLVEGIVKRNCNLLQNQTCSIIPSQIVLLCTGQAFPFPWYYIHSRFFVTPRNPAIFRIKRLCMPMMYFSFELNNVVLIIPTRDSFIWCLLVS